MIQTSNGISLHFETIRKHAMGGNDIIVEIGRRVGSPAHKYNHSKVNTYIIILHWIWTKQNYTHKNLNQPGLQNQKAPHIQNCRDEEDALSKFKLPSRVKILAYQGYTLDWKACEKKFELLILRCSPLHWSVRSKEENCQTNLIKSKINRDKTFSSPEVESNVSDHRLR